MLALPLLAIFSAAANGTVRYASDLTSQTIRHPTVGQAFELTCTIVSQAGSSPVDFSAEDETGATLFTLAPCATNETIRPGDRVTILGTTAISHFDHVYASVTSIVRLASCRPREPVPATFEDILSGRCDCRLVKTRGILRDVFRDEIDPSYNYLVLKSGSQTLYVPSPNFLIDNTLLGADCTVTGLCIPRISGARRHLGRVVELARADDFCVLTPPDSDPFDAPPLEDGYQDPSEVQSMGMRRIVGKVLATWQRKNILVKTTDGRLVKLNVAGPDLPPFGAAITAVGFPETDLFSLNLTRAIWRQAHDVPETVETTASVGADALLSDGAGDFKIHPEFNGRTVRMVGRVRHLPAADTGVLHIENRSLLIPVDVSAAPTALNTLELDCTIEVTGVCIMETENWRPNCVFPHAKGFTLVVRTPDDIRIVSRPPWWTPGRLLAVIGSLLAVLAAIFVWNISLRRLVERRGRELAEETVSRVTADLKVYERTRLAVELHDSIAQNLTGVALEINTANRTAGTDPAKAQRHLDIAAKSLKSCRDELRYCLWDLRNSALESADMEEAIRQTLAPHIGETALSIRFSVPRIRISDNTAHAILRIVRELSVNAIRHGGATSLRVAGSVEGDKLLFSVRDNGCGFDPANCPGVRQGHYGLLGIRERVEGFEGEVRIDSAPGRGTKVTVALNVPQESPKENPS